MNLYPVVSLLRHRLLARSTAGHGVHSPYIYDFLTTVLRNKTPGHIVNHVEGLRKDMLNDNRIISVTDLGAGSLKSKESERRICDIARWASLPVSYAGLLARIAGSIEQGAWGKERRVEREERRAESEEQREWSGERREGIVLELGTSLGISTMALALAAPEIRVVTVEGCPALAEIAAQNLEQHEVRNVEIINKEFSIALREIKERGENVVLAFIDGNHRGAALTEYVREIRNMGEEMIIVTDDIHLSREMYRAWEELKRSVMGATIETKRFGLEIIKSRLTPGEYRIWC